MRPSSASTIDASPWTRSTRPRTHSAASTDRIRPYVIGGAGIYADGGTDFGINLGAGTTFPLGLGDSPARHSLSRSMTCGIVFLSIVSVQVLVGLIVVISVSPVCFENQVKTESHDALSKE